MNGHFSGVWVHTMAHRILLGIIVTFSMISLPAYGVEAEPLSVKDLERIWSDFGQNDEAGSRTALQGIQLMIRAPKLAVPFLKKRLKAVSAPNYKRIDQCIADLDSSDFSVREKATRELEALGASILPALEKKLQEKNLPLEMSNRLRRLQQNLEERELPIDELRSIRAIEVLLGIANAAAIAVLEDLARGADGQRLTSNARKALSVIARRNSR